MKIIKMLAYVVRLIVNFVKTANDVLENEVKSLKAVKKSLNANFTEIVNFIMNCKGRILVSGLGKSGLIGRKISATFSSVGVPSFFIHPVEAIHGDLGSFEKDDVLLALSCSGNTKEVKDVVLFCKKHHINTIAITCNKNSYLAKNCDFAINLEMEKEAIEGFPVPTSSCIMMLAICDAITACVIKDKNFSQEEYVEFHSGGSIGKRIKTAITKSKKTYKKGKTKK